MGEETGDFGGLSKYLEFADFVDGEGDDPIDSGAIQSSKRDGVPWTGKHNIAMFFAPASMIVLFCEVPADAVSNTERMATGGVPVNQDDSEATPSASGEKDAADGPKIKKRKVKEEPPLKPSPNYRVGKTDHLESVWIDATVLRSAVESHEKAPKLSVGNQECCLFPMNTGILRLPDARRWLGAAVATTVTKDAKPENKVV